MGIGNGRQLTGSNIGSDWLLLAALEKMSKRVWLGFVTRSAVTIGRSGEGRSAGKGQWTGTWTGGTTTSVGLFRMRCRGMKESEVAIWRRSGSSSLDSERATALRTCEIRDKAGN